MFSEIYIFIHAYAIFFKNQRGFTIFLVFFHTSLSQLKLEKHFSALIITFYSQYSSILFSKYFLLLLEELLESLYTSSWVKLSSYNATLTWVFWLLYPPLYKSNIVQLSGWGVVPDQASGNDTFQTGSQTAVVTRLERIQGNFRINVTVWRVKCPTFLVRTFGMQSETIKTGRIQKNVD